MLDIGVVQMRAKASCVDRSVTWIWIEKIDADLTWFDRYQIVETKSLAERSIGERTRLAEGERIEKLGLGLGVWEDLAL